MPTLSVNINKVASLRNARGGKHPDPIRFAQKLLSLGVSGITVHPRPDQRHITPQDVYDLARLLKNAEKFAELNIEGYPSKEFITLIAELRPQQCTLVPDAPDVLTSNAGWQISRQHNLLENIRKELPNETKISLFIDPNDYINKEISAAKTIANLGFQRIELYTGAYADAFAQGRHQQVIEPYKTFAFTCREFSLGINAGHDLDTVNLPYLLREIPIIEEVSIGHALIADCLYWGVEATIKNYFAAVQS
jgi:pyridoxine 5-phosphate synthase